MNKTDLINKVLEQIYTDVSSNDFTAIAELLATVDEEVLLGYLNEE